VVNDAAGDPPADGEDAGTGGGAATPSAGSGRSTRPAPARPGSQLPEPDGGASPDPHWFDASGLDGLLGTGLPPAGAGPSAGAPPDAGDELAGDVGGLEGRAGSSPALLGLSVAIMLALGGGLAFRWWDRRPDRYWPA
jgi:hypothetical protein